MDKCNISTRCEDDYIDALRYAYDIYDISNNTDYTHYSFYVRGSTFPKPSDNPNRLIDLGLRIKKVIFNPPATIVLWADGSKTVVKCSKDDTFDYEKGLAIAICKKILGYQFKKTFKEYTPYSIKSATSKTIKIDFNIDKAVESLRNLNTKLVNDISNKLNTRD